MEKHGVLAGLIILALEAGLLNINHLHPKSGARRNPEVGGSNPSSTIEEITMAKIESVVFSGGRAVIKFSDISREDLTKILEACGPTDAETETATFSGEWSFPPAGQEIIETKPPRKKRRKRGKKAPLKGKRKYRKRRKKGKKK